jgi:hypothetical protein
MGTGSRSPAVKRPRGESNNSSPSNTKAKNAWLYLHSSMWLHDGARNKHTTILLFLCFYFQMEPNGHFRTQDALSPERRRVSTGNEKRRASESEYVAGNRIPIPQSSTALPNHRPTEVESAFETWQLKYTNYMLTLLTFKNRVQNLSWTHTHTYLKANILTEGSMLNGAESDGGIQFILFNCFRACDVKSYKSIILQSATAVRMLRWCSS